MKILIIDKNLVDPINHFKWRLLAEKPEVELVGITPDRWIENSRVLHPSREDASGFPIVPLKVLWPGYENRSFYIWGLRRVIRLTSPDTVIVFEEPYSLFAAQSVAAVKQIVPHAKIFIYTWDNLSKGFQYPYRPRFLYRFIERWVISRVRMVLAANQEAADSFKNMYSIEVQKVYFGIDVRAFTDIKKTINYNDHTLGRFQVGYIGRIISKKGLDALIEALNLLPESVRLLLVGSGPDGELLLERVHALGLSNRVEFHPSVTSQKVREFFSKIDVLVLPSKTTKTWKEQYGRVLIEAMASGVPVIGSSSGAIPEVLDKAGLIFKEGDVRELASCIEKLKDNPDLRQKLVASGKERMMLFSADRFAENIYNLLVKEAKAPIDSNLGLARE